MQNTRDLNISCKWAVEDKEGLDTQCNALHTAEQPSLCPTRHSVPIFVLMLSLHFTAPSPFPKHNHTSRTPADRMAHCWTSTGRV